MVHLSLCDVLIWERVHLPNIVTGAGTSGQDHLQ